MRRKLQVGDMVRINTHNKPYLIPELDLPYDSSTTPTLHLGEVGIVLEPVRDGKFYMGLCKVITRYGAGWVSKLCLEVMK